MYKSKVKRHQYSITTVTTITIKRERNQPRKEEKRRKRGRSCEYLCLRTCMYVMSDTCTINRVYVSTHVRYTRTIRTLNGRSRRIEIFLKRLKSPQFYILQPRYPGTSNVTCLHTFPFIHTTYIHDV